MNKRETVKALGEAWEFARLAGDGNLDALQAALSIYHDVLIELVMRLPSDAPNKETNPNG